jgi:hypothetical protein
MEHSFIMLKLDSECWDLPVYSGFQCAALKLDAADSSVLAARIVFGCQITAQMQERIQMTIHDGSFFIWR